MRDLRGASVVITGASSGIGRATAHAFARHGARLTLAARREDILQDVVRECEQLGSDAVAIATDVTDPDAVRALAQAAEDAFGGIDIWVNNAGTGVAGPYQDGRLELHRRTIEVNLLGAMYGAHAVLPLFLRQGHGTLINTVSMGAWAPNAFAASYTASKFGLRGFAASLRQELGDHPGIHVCGVFPAIIDTPGLQHGANVSGRRINPGPLIYAPEAVARTIVALAQRPRAEVAVGWPARTAQAAYALMPRPTERLMGYFARRALGRAAPAPRTDGTVLQPGPQGASVSGGLRDQKNVPSAGKLTAIGLAAGAVILMGTTALASARGSRRAR